MSHRPRLAACLFALCLGWPGLLSAQGTSDPDIDALDRRVRQFFDGVAADNAQAAYQQLLAGSQLAKQTDADQGPGREDPRSENQVRRLPQLRAGGREADAARTWSVLTYLYQCEHFPVVWHVTFYRSAQRGDPAGRSAAPGGSSSSASTPTLRPWPSDMDGDGCFPAARAVTIRDEVSSAAPVRCGRG